MGMGGLMPIETIEEFENRMKALGASGLLMSMKKEMGNIALRSERYAKLNATGAPRVRTGRLRSSISASVHPKGNSIEIHVGAGASSRQKWLSPATNKPPKSHGFVPYAAIQEFGGTVKLRSGSKTRAGGFRQPQSAGGGGKTITIKANRYLGKGVDQALKEAPALLSSAVKTTILGKGA